MDRQYDVEAILRRKIVDGKVFYRIKWLNFASKLNTWEPEENLFCNEILERFIISRANKIISEYFLSYSVELCLTFEIIQGARQTPYGITYLVGWADGFDPKSYSVIEAHGMFANLVINFLDENIEFVRRVSGGIPQNPAISQRQPIGNPIAIVCRFSQHLLHIELFLIIRFSSIKNFFYS